MRTQPDREAIALGPKSVGKIANAHKADLNGPWTMSIEPIFGTADRELHYVVKRLLERFPELEPGNDLRILERLDIWSKRLNAKAMALKDFRARLLPFQFENQDRNHLGEGVASLVVRSPGFRNQLMRITNSSRSKFGLPPVSERDNLVVMAIEDQYGPMITLLEKANFVLLLSHERELVIGDGYLHNLFSTGPRFDHFKVLVPLAPRIACLGFWEPDLNQSRAVFSCVVTADEADQINQISQIYSRDYLHYRHDEPQLIDAFYRHAFMHIKGHRHPLIEKILEAARATGSASAEGKAV